MINTENIENLKVGEEQLIKVVFYPNLEAIKTKCVVDVSTIIKYIKTNDIALNYRKDNLPVVFFSVLDFDGRKEIQNVIGHTGLVIIDIDVKDNTELDFDSLKKNLIKDDYVFACFKSPSGGLKVIVNTTLENTNHHHAYYNGVKFHLLNKYPQIIKIDTGNNLNRACYLPFDKDIYYNPKSTRFDMPIHESSDNIKRKPVNNTISEYSCTLDSHYSLDEHIDNLLRLPLNRTTVPLYHFLFNNYRYKGIERSIMSTNVLILELEILKYTFPYRLDYTTHIDDVYFEKDINEVLHIYKLGSQEGLDYCELVLDEIIKEGYRGKTLFNITVKLLFNNPLCHPAYIFKEVKRINDTYSEDPHPETNPKPDDVEVQKIVEIVYERYLSGTLDFSRVIRKNKRTLLPMKKKTFKSRMNGIKDKNESRSLAIIAFVRGEKEKMNERYIETIKMLQDGHKITQKRISDAMGVSERTVKRYQTPEIKNLIKEYNTSLKKSPPVISQDIKKEPEVREIREVTESVFSSIHSSHELARNTEVIEIDYESIFQVLYADTIKRTDRRKVELLFDEFKKLYDFLLPDDRCLIQMKEEEIPTEEFWRIHDYRFSFKMNTLKIVEELCCNCVA